MKINDRLFYLVLFISTFFALVFNANRTLAGCGFLDITCDPEKWDNPIDTIENNVRDATFFTFNVHVKNNTNKPIYVTAEWYVIRPTESCSTIDGGGENCGGSQWISGSWLVNPNKEVFIINDAKGRNILLSARSTDGQFVWNEREVDMGPRYTNFYYSFNP